MLNFLQVRYAMTTFDLRKPYEAFRFVFQLYNFVHRAFSDSDNLEDPSDQVRQVKSEVAAKHYNSITTTLKRKPDDDGNIDGGKRQNTGTQQGEGNVLSRPSVSAMLAAAGYRLTPDPSWGIPLDPVRSFFVLTG